MKLRLSLTIFFSTWPYLYGTTGHKDTITITTTTGRLRGVTEEGVSSFKGVRFGVAPTGALRWQPPVAFRSSAVQDASKLGPSCVQQFPFASANLTRLLYNNPPPPEDEDCLFLNVWTPSPVAPSLKLKPVVVWIYGGGFVFGTGSLRMYDGTSMTKNQDIVTVSFNYRTNVFGFPTSPDLPLVENNLGLLDQELALNWVRENIVHFGGDPNQVTIMGHSAGGWSIAAAINRNQEGFNAAIMLSGAPLPANVPPNFTPFNDFANAMNCKQSPGPARLACLRQVPAAVISDFVNGPSGGTFSLVLDNLTYFGDPLGRVLAHKTRRTPLMIGGTQNDASLFILGITDLGELLQLTLPGVPVTADQIRALYPGKSDIQVIEAFSTDLSFRCPTSLWAATMVKAGVKNVFRYTYGAVFPDTQLFPNAGVWHGSELELVFGTFNRTSSSNDKVLLSKSLQTAIGNFVKNPTTRSPAPNWNQYDPAQKTLAELGFNGNVDFGDFVNPVTSDVEDGACNAFLNVILNPGS